MKIDNIAKAAKESASTVPGVKKTILAKAVKGKDKEITVDISIIVAYGTKIPQLAWELQRKVQWDIVMETGIKVNDINIHVEGVDMGEV